MRNERGEEAIKERQKTERSRTTTKKMKKEEGEEAEGELCVLTEWTEKEGKHTERDVCCLKGGFCSSHCLSLLKPRKGNEAERNEKQRDGFLLKNGGFKPKNLSLVLQSFFANSPKLFNPISSSGNLLLPLRCCFVFVLFLSPGRHETSSQEENISHRKLSKCLQLKLKD